MHCEIWTLIRVPGPWPGRRTTVDPERLCFGVCIATLSALQHVTGVLCFPDRWKLSFVSLIFKSGRRNHVSNYRGIAILSTVGKFFELLVYRHMYEDLKGQLADCQHGFVKGRSTVSGVRCVRCQVDSIYTDFSKAFDKVRHRLLLDKMSTHVEPSRCQWLGSYFSGRIQ
jgi:hypothetical protein